MLKLVYSKRLGNCIITEETFAGKQISDVKLIPL